VTATGQLVHWSGLGALLLVLLFQASSDFSEKLTKEKYPRYREYQKSHCRFLPLGTLLAAHDETDR
jgi:steroid 5-alpha reductase family enzyme